MPAMALSQPGSAEKTIRKIDIAQVKKKKLQPAKCAQHLN